MTFPQRQRCGYSLLEMQVVLLLGALLLGACATLITTLLRGDQTFRDLRQQRQSLDRLEWRFTEDTHQAQTAVLLDPATCQLTLADGQQLTYTVEPKQIIRRLTAENILLHRDDFLLPALTSGAWQIQPAPLSPLLSLTLLAQPADPLKSFPSLLDTSLQGTTLLAAVGISAPPLPQGAQP